MTGEQQIDYEALAQDAMRGIVRSALRRVAGLGYLPGEHHFYIAFDTRAPGVVISKRLKEKYPEEMTIVLQHQFRELSVDDDRFEVTLSFNNLPERLTIPLRAVRVFFDPSVRYGIQFDSSDLVQVAAEETEPQAADAVEADGDRLAEAARRRPGRPWASRPRPQSRAARASLAVRGTKGTRQDPARQSRRVPLTLPRPPSPTAPFSGARRVDPSWSGRARNSPSTLPTTPRWSSSTSSEKGRCSIDLASRAEFAPAHGVAYKRADTQMPPSTRTGWRLTRNGLAGHGFHVPYK